MDALKQEGRQISGLKEKVLEIADIAKACPENLQAACFELLLRDALDERSRKLEKGSAAGRQAKAEAPKEATDTSGDATDRKNAPPAGAAPSQDDISESELHVKTKHFMKTRGVTIQELNNLFYKEDDAYLPLFEDLKTTRMAEGQVRVALMLSLKNALGTGDFSASMQDVRSEANARKCYDLSNWGRNFNNNAAFFDFEKYDKTLTQVRLSEDGKKELAALIKELQ